jgi:CheY-like chemotaxis protein
VLVALATTAASAAPGEDRPASSALTVGDVAPAVYEVFDLMRLTTLLDVRPGGRAGAGALVVDDEAAGRDVLGAWLRGHGFTVWLRATGLEGLGLYRQHHPAIGLVLLDVRMPGLSGPATLDALRRLNPEVRCCFPCAGPWPHARESLPDRGAVQVFQKPFDLGEVAQGVRRLPECPGSPG